jgi:ABC-2 type transport system ATP-binding protein
LLFLDEPTTGLDPRSRNQVWEIVRVLVAAGTTVLLTTQYLDEADQLADRIAIIDHGRVIAEGTPGELKALVGSGTLRLRVLDPSQRPTAERIVADALGEPVLLESDPATLTTRASDPDRVAGVLTELSRAGVAVAELSLGQPSLDEVFLALTGHPAEEQADDTEEAARRRSRPRPRSPPSRCAPRCRPARARRGRRRRRPPSPSPGGRS